MASWTSANGLANTVQYDGDLRPTSISVPHVESLGFTYKERGQVHLRVDEARTYNPAEHWPLHRRRAKADACRMARLPRIELAGVPQHVVQRGNNRLPCFLDDSDRLLYLRLLSEALRECGCALHAYVLMDNHVHLLLTPAALGAVSILMQTLGRRYVQQFNARHRRSGTLWEGRYKACLVDSTVYVPRCQRYVDLNPIRARMTDDAAAFRWSSCASNCGLRDDPLVEHHPAYTALGASREERARVYRKLLDEAIPEVELAEIRVYLKQQRALGRDAFRAMVEAKTQRFSGVRPAHRPTGTARLADKST